MFGSCCGTENGGGNICLGKLTLGSIFHRIPGGGGRQTSIGPLAILPAPAPGPDPLGPCPGPLPPGGGPGGSPGGGPGGDPGGGPGGHDGGKSIELGGLYKGNLLLGGK